MLELSTSDFLVGLLFFALVVGGAGFATYRVDRWAFVGLRPSARIPAQALVFTAVLLAVHLLPGIAEVMTRTVVAVLAVAVAIASTRLPVRGGGPDLGAALEGWRSESRASLAVAGVAAVVVGAYCISAIPIATTPATGLDALGFHIPGLGRWVQSDTIWNIEHIGAQIATGYYPQDGNLIQLTAVLPWESDFLYRLVNLPFMGFLFLAVYGIGRELQASRPTALAIGAAMLAMPTVAVPGLLAAIPDVILLAALATGLLFLLRESRTHRAVDLILAGVALGIAFGSKWYGVTTVGVVLVLWGIYVLATQRRDGLLRRCLPIAGLVLAFGGFWLLRNLVASGNPFYPARVSFGVGVFDAPPDPRGDEIASIADYAGDPSAWADYILPAFAEQLGLVGPLLGLAVLITAVFAGRDLFAGRTPRRDAAIGAILVAGAVLFAVVYAATPSTAPGFGGEPTGIGFNVRYLVPALLFAAAALAWLDRRLPRFAIWIQGATAIATLEALTRGETLSNGGLLVGVLILGGLYLWLLRGRPGVPTWLARAPAAALAALAALAVAVVIGFAEHRFSERSYGGYAAIDWVLENAPADQKVGMVGLWNVTVKTPVRALFGPRFENEVDYVGYIADGELRRWEAREPFVEDVEATGYDLLLIGRGLGEVALEVPEEVWARSAGYREVARDDNFTLYARAS